MSAAGSSSKKRTAEELDPLQTESAQKIAKIHPFFGKKVDPVPAGPFQWLNPLGPTRSCLHGLNLDPKPSTKVAAFDLDGTLIKSEFGSSIKPLAPASWQWWRSSIPAKLKELAESGDYSLQPGAQASSAQNLEAENPFYRSRSECLVEPESVSHLNPMKLPDVPFRLFAATAKDGFRKPMPGMWTELERIFREEGIEIDKINSFFVGDAAGRQYAGNKSDFSSTDRKWALNIGIPFFTPEEYFLHLPPHTKYSLPGFHVSSLPDNLPSVTPTSTPVLPMPFKQELILFVGYPCLGKTSFYRHHFQSAGYIHINQDTLRTRDKCVKEMQKALQDGKSCVIDNTNRNAATRKYYIDIARQLKIQARCFLFTGSIELAWHNNLYRTYNLPPSIATTEPKRELVPYIGFSGFRDNFEEPQLEEGFTEIKKVNWVFNGTEEEKRYWSSWLQIDGK